MAAGRSFFLTLDTTSRGKHFHEPGGIHLILPSLFNIHYLTYEKLCQVFFNALTFYLHEGPVAQYVNVILSPLVTGVTLWAHKEVNIKVSPELNWQVFLSP